MHCVRIVVGGLVLSVVALPAMVEGQQHHPAGRASTFIERRDTLRWIRARTATPSRPAGLDTLIFLRRGDVTYLRREHRWVPLSADLARHLRNVQQEAKEFDRMQTKLWPTLPKP